MNEVDFLRGIEGEEQQGSDLVSGAEHLVRLKVQSGQQTQQQYPDLELQKEAFFNSSAPHPQAAYTDALNHPDNVARVNQLMEDYSRKNYAHADKVHPLSNLHPSEWELAYAHAMSDPHFRGIYDQHFGTKKEAKIFGRPVPNTIEHEAIPLKTREKHFKEYADTKAQEEPTGYLKGIGGGALLGGGLGAAIGALGAHGNYLPVTQGLRYGAMVGGGIGGLGGALAAAHDKSNISKMRDVVKNKSYADGMAHQIADDIDARRDAEWWNDERRHHQILRGLRKEADLSESIGSAAMCKGCGKVKEACGCGTKMAAAETLKAALREKLAAPSPEWNKAMLAATTGLGALAGGIGTYLSSRPQEDTGKSKMEEDLGAAVEANKMKPERGFLEKLKNREVESAHGISRVFREHPVKASLLGTLTGAASGYGIGQLGGAISRLRGGK